MDCAKFKSVFFGDYFSFCDVIQSDEIQYTLFVDCSNMYPQL